MLGWFRRVGAGVAALALLTGFAFAVHGYHPYAEDGGLYVAGIKRLLDPTLYGPHPEFVTEHLRFSYFAPLLAGFVRLTHLPLAWILLGLYLASVAATLYAAWMLAARCTQSIQGRAGAVALLACWLTLPIAGTSLMLVDPYLTARSLSTPLVIAALAWTFDAIRGLRRGAWLAGTALLAAATMHPLMAAYGLAAVLVFVAISSRRPWLAAGSLGAAALVVAGAVHAMAPAESADYVWIVRTRYYWFVSEWQWYERLGLVAPLLILAWMGFRSDRPAAGLLARAALALGFIAAAVNLSFAHVGFATHLIARLQPLRCFQLVYVVMILLIGIWLGEHVLCDRSWRWFAALALLGGVMFAVERSTYPASAQIEWPGVAPGNLWEQAFLWVRDNTPKDALFAMNPHYIQAEGEDAQCFRAIAERNALADYSKDGGEASIMPALTPDWVRSQAAQAHIDDEIDQDRTARLQPLGVDWVILRADSSTAWECPYANRLVKVCKLR